MRPTDRIRASLGQTEVAHFSCLNEGLYRSGNILHGYVRINTVLVEEVDPIGTQALERLVDDLYIEAWAIGFGLIEEGDASVIGGADYLDGLILFCRGA